jgi:hypothetical protein
MNELIYTTKDLAAAAFIRYNEVKMATDENHKGYNINTKCWLFSNPEKCKELDFLLRNGDAQVEVLKYENARKSLLTMANSKY